MDSSKNSSVGYAFNVVSKVKVQQAPLQGIMRILLDFIRDQGSAQNALLFIHITFL